MGWLRIALTEEEQQILQQQRDSHPSDLARRRLLVIWSLHCGLLREQAALVADVDLSTVQRDVRLYREGGLSALLESEPRKLPVSELAQFADLIRQSLEQQPVRTIAEAGQRIEELTGLQRKPTQVRQFLKKMGLKWQMVRALPVPPKKV